MIFLIFILNFLSADELKLNFIDWNYDTKIEIDSLNIVNPDYGIDTTLINPKTVDLRNLLIINSVELKKFGVVYSNNILKITSKEIINHIEIIDLLGKKVFEANPNSYNYEKNISLNENLSFIILTIGNKRYTQKLYNVNQEVFYSPSILLSAKDKWQFTPYKDKYRDTTYIFTDDMLLGGSLDIELKRERYKVSMSFNFEKISVSNNDVDFNPVTNENIGRDTNYITTMNKTINFILFEQKHFKLFYEFRCYNTTSLIMYGDKYIQYNESKYEGISAVQLFMTSDSIAVFNFGKRDFSSEGYNYNCTTEILTMRLNTPIKIENSIRETTNSDMYFYYEEGYQNKRSTYSWHDINKKNIGKVNITITIEKID